MIFKSLIAPLFLFALCLAFAPHAVAQGGKAEPLRVQFPRGSTSATFNGTVRGDQQFEYAVEAKAGQWLLVEITSTPRDSAIFLIKDSDGNDGSYHYYWSDTLGKAGEYLIFVTKPGDFSSSRFSLTITLESKPPKIGYSSADATLSSAMRKLIHALRSRNTSLFLSLFSRRRPFYHLNPMNVGSKQYFRDSITYARLLKDVRNKGDLYWLLIERADNGNYDAFVDNFPDDTIWIRVRGNKFVPPGAGLTSHTYVRWRKENGRWVIDEISYATA